MSEYRISARAAAEIVDISDYGISQFGPNQAAKYHASLQRTFEILAMFPRIGLPCYDLEDGLYRFPHKSHMIFYVHTTDGILIARILHAGADFKRIFRPDA